MQTLWPHRRTQLMSVILKLEKHCPQYLDLLTQLIPQQPSESHYYHLHCAYEG